MNAVQSGTAASDRQAWAAREIGAPLEEIDKTLGQNLRLEAATPYSVTVLLDRPKPVGSSLQFDHLERHIISATTDGKITELIYSTDIYRQNSGLVRSVTWSTQNANQGRSTPLFQFYGGDGAPVTATDAPSLATRVLVTIATMRDGRSYEGTRTVFFRNR
jgi:hypothetical protein